ncbi:MFS transporter [Candidatus Bathyarchaeota archaeon]|nr:MFS transporter [Candidatus Bathyarchaeota archaeon]
MNLGTKNTGTAVFWSLCLMGGFMILSSTMSKSGSVFNPFSKSLGTPDAWSGLLVSASTIPGILVSLPAASLSDIFGRKRFLLLAGIVFASAPFLYLVITAWWQLILVRFYHGFATAIFVPVAEASIAELFPAKRGERISLFTSATYVGRIIAPTLGGYILFASNNDFHQAYLAVAAAAMAGLLTALPFLARKGQSTPVSRQPAGEAIKKMFFGWRRLVGNEGMLIVSLIQASQYYVFGAFDYYLADYLINDLKYNTLKQGLFASSVFAVAIFARPSMGRVSDRIGRRIPIVLGSILSALALLTIPYITDFTALMILLVAYGFGFAAVTSSTSPLISELAPKELVGTSMGFLDTMMDVGQTIGGFATGLVFATSLHYVGVFLSFAIVLFLSCTVFAISSVGKRNWNKSR